VILGNDYQCPAQVSPLLINARSDIRGAERPDVFLQVID
jgi:hypothetical protein